MGKACRRWTRKPANQRATEEQCRAHFKEYYEYLEDEDEQLHNGGIANNVVLQQTQDALQEVQQKLEIQHAENALIKAKLADVEQKHSANASVISGLSDLSKFNAL